MTTGHTDSRLVRGQGSERVRRALLHRLADGCCVVVPREKVGRRWMPGLETAAAGIASAIYDPGSIIVMGVSAARLYGVGSIDSDTFDKWRQSRISLMWSVVENCCDPDLVAFCHGCTARHATRA